MIYNNSKEYTLHYYIDSTTNKKPSREFISSLDNKVKAKVRTYFEYLQQHNGYLDEPYSRHIIDKIRELRVDFATIRHRIFYFTFIDKKIIILHGFIKKVQKTPDREISLALKRYHS